MQGETCTLQTSSRTTCCVSHPTAPRLENLSQLAPAVWTALTTSRSLQFRARDRRPTEGFLKEWVARASPSAHPSRTLGADERARITARRTASAVTQRG